VFQLVYMGCMEVVHGIIKRGGTTFMFLHTITPFPEFGFKIS
jgi:hypothetical protein